MTDTARKDHDPEASDFEQLASGKRQGMVAEFWDFLKHNKKWWLLPIILVIVGLGALVLLGGSAFAPFIYTLF